MDTEKNGIRESIRVSLVFHLLIGLIGLGAYDGGVLMKIAGITLVPYWSMVVVIVWKRRDRATWMDRAFIAYLYPVLFGGFFLWNDLQA